MRIRWLKYLIGGAFLLIAVGVVSLTVNAKKIKTSFKVDKDSSKKNKDSNAPSGVLIDGIPIEVGDIENFQIDLGDEYANQIARINFVGFDKEVNSSKESFMLVNPSDFNITGFKVRLDYFDMQDRMLHSRTITQECLVPEGETRKFDIKSWDTQHTYYYYLGNEPKKVATPFKVLMTPLVIWIEDQSR